MSHLHLDEMVPRVVALQNHASSGSSFLYSLFDSHPQVLQLPFDHGKWIYAFLSKHENLSPEQQVEAFVKGKTNWFDETTARRDPHLRYLGMHHLGANADETTVVSRDAFGSALIDYLNRLDGPWRKRFFAAVHLAYAHALGREVEFPAVLLFFIHSLPAEFVRMLVQDFPDALFLYTVRNPVQNVGSQVKHYLTSPVLNGYWNHNISQIAVGRILADVGVDKNNQQMHGDRPYFALYDERSRAVRLEDLHERSDVVLRSICNWIGIRWHECLLESTCNGKRWWNKADKVQMGGFGTSTINQTHVDLLSRFDKARLAAVVRNKCRVWNYPAAAFFSSRFGRRLLLPSLLLPFSMERRTLPSQYRTLKSLRPVVAKLPPSFRVVYDRHMKLAQARRAADQYAEPWIEEHIRDGKIQPGGVRITVDSTESGKVRFIFRQDEEDIARNVRRIEVPGDSQSQSWRTRLAGWGLYALFAARWTELIVRDYFGNRRLLLLAWLEGRKEPPLEVPLLPLEAGEPDRVVTIDHAGSVLLPEPRQLAGPHYDRNDLPPDKTGLWRLTRDS